MKQPGHDTETNGEVGPEELARVDALLAALPPVEPRPAVVREVLERVGAKGGARAGRPARRRHWFWGLATASGAAAAALIAVAGGRRADMAPPMQEAQAPPPVATKNELAQAGEGQPVGGAVVDEAYRLRGEPRVAEKGEGKEDNGGRFAVTVEGWQQPVDLRTDGDLENTRDRSGLLGGEALADGLVAGKDQTLDWSRRGFLAVDKDRFEAMGDEGQNGLGVPAANDFARPEAGAEDLPSAMNGKQSESQVWGDETGRDGNVEAPADPAQLTTPARGPVAAGALREQTIAGNDAPLEEEKPKVEAEALEKDGRKSLLQTVTSTLDKEEVPSFIEARGYFANTYLPGDAELSWLRAQVAGGVPALGGLSLDTLAVPVAQPFDAPREGALGLHLASDVASFAGDAEGPRRATLQVGLKGATQAPTRRSAVNLALVVDVTGVADENERRALWALAESIVAQAQPEDRITLVVHTGDVQRAPQAVSAVRGEVSRVLAEAYETRGGARPLSDAVGAAYAAVRAGAREDAAMGADLVVVATPTLGGMDGFVDRAHAEALGGVHLSAMGVGKRVDLGALRTLALAGQGRAALVHSPAEAGGVAESELAAAGRVVARAVRLRVRLGDGVRLVSVLGSRRLDERDADKVRAAEKKIDLEVERSTGIDADRGADEDGIQIVIPAFMAGDDHVILFDVVVEKPGLIMDVRARFKDLVRLGNGEVSASLSLSAEGAGRTSPRAEQVNVTRNLAARKTSDALVLAARMVRAGELARGREAVAAGRADVERLALRSGLDKDPALAGDLRLLGAFERALIAPEGVALAALESSLRLAARMELGAR